MCGICGVYEREEEKKVLDSTLQDMLSAIVHRGPDDYGTYLQGNVGLGIRRLSIIDLEGGHQPIANEDGMVWVVYNGEIYNYLPLMAELRAKGHRFTTRCDTEVIVHCYEEYGFECVKKLRGMFAFAIWDQRKRRLFLARDRVGIKPLYYYYDGKRLVFGSEIKAIIRDRSIPREIDYAGLNNYFTFGHSVAPDTMYRNIKKLLPGHYLVCDAERFDIREFWDIPSVSPGDSAVRPKEVSVREYARRVRELLKEAVRIRLMSDVPLGAFLSGGIDSSTVVGLMSEVMDQPAKTFSLGFEIGGAFNELEDARLVADHFQTEHYELRVTSEDLVDTLQTLVYHYDEPFGDAACFPTYLVSRFAREHVKVVLTGEGGDEIFGGYIRYIAEGVSSFFRRLPAFLRDDVIAGGIRAMPRLRKLKRAMQAMSVVEPDVRYGSWLTQFNDQMKSQLFSPDILEQIQKHDPYHPYRTYYNRNGQADLLGRMLYTDIKTWLPDTYLEKVDKASMAVSLEARVPFLDSRLLEYVFTIPSRYKIRGLTTKYILKKAVEDLLPASVLRKPKHGFAVPTDPWFRGELEDFAFEVLMDGQLRHRGYFNFSYVEQLYREHQTGRHVHNNQLWLLLNFELWHRTFLTV